MLHLNTGDCFGLRGEGGAFWDEGLAGCQHVHTLTAVCPFCRRSISILCQTAV